MRANRWISVLAVLGVLVHAAAVVHHAARQTGAALEHRTLLADLAKLCHGGAATQAAAAPELPIIPPPADTQDDCPLCCALGSAALLAPEPASLATPMSAAVALVTQRFVYRTSATRFVLRPAPLLPSLETLPTLISIQQERAGQDRCDIEHEIQSLEYGLVAVAMLAWLPAAPGHFAPDPAAVVAGTPALLRVQDKKAAPTFKIGDLVIEAPWVRATPGGAKVAGGYFKITNTGKEADRLIGGSLPIATEVEVHEMAMTNNVMKMRRLADGLEIKPGQSVELKPGGYHVMFMGLSAGLKAGQTVKGTLVFQKAGTVEVEFRVAPIGAQSGGGGHAQH